MEQANPRKFRFLRIGYAVLVERSPRVSTLAERPWAANCGRSCCIPPNRYRVKHDYAIELIEKNSFRPDRRIDKITCIMARDYDEKLEENARRKRDDSRKRREIGDLPPVEDPERRERCRYSLRLFCETYLRDRFSLEWAQFHLDIIATLEQSVLHGGMFAMAMPRGSGKTVLTEASTLWAITYGYRRYVVALAAEAKLACDILDSIKNVVEQNDVFAADFPEICVPVRMLEGINQKAPGQTHQGQQTRITWTGDTIVMPTIQGSSCSGSIITARGLTAAIRGLKQAIGNTIVRPDYVLLDDPQTDESARSPYQTAQRERIINGAVLGLAGPLTKITAVVPCTIIAKGDLSSILLDRELSPSWKGRRYGMLEKMPKNTAKWDEYSELSRQSMRAYEDNRLGHEYYAKHRGEMDEGAVVTWPARVKEGDLSALQSAMDSYYYSPSMFAAEFQNCPVDMATGASMTIDATHVIASQVLSPMRSFVPESALKLTAYVDVGGHLLHYMVVAWDANFCGHIVDYGVYPEQARSYYDSLDARPSIATTYPSLDPQSATYAALKTLLPRVVRDWPRHGGGVVPMDRVLIDSGYHRDAVYQFCSASEHRKILKPSKGASMGKTTKPMHEWAKKTGVVAGWNWQLDNEKVLIDTNAWKTFVAEAVIAPLGSKRKITLFPAQDHALLADHIASEYADAYTNERTGLRTNLWAKRPAAENHWWDCLVGCAVAASVSGIAWHSGAGVGDGPSEAKKAEKIRLSELYRKKHGGKNGRK